MELSNELETKENSGAGPTSQKPTEDETEELLKKLHLAAEKTADSKGLQAATQPGASATATQPARAGAAAVVTREVSEGQRYPTNSVGQRRQRNLVGLHNQEDLCCANSALQMLCFCKV